MFFNIIKMILIQNLKTLKMKTENYRKKKLKHELLDVIPLHTQ